MFHGGCKERSLPAARTEVAQRNRMAQGRRSVLEDKTPVNHDSQIHLNYVLTLDGRERDEAVTAKLAPMLMDMTALTR